MYIRSAWMLKYQFLAQFPMEQLTHSVVSVSVNLFGLFVAINYFVIGVTIIRNRQFSYCALSICCLLVFMILYAALKRYSVPLLKFSLFIHAQVIWFCGMKLIFCITKSNISDCTPAERYSTNECPGYDIKQHLKMRLLITAKKHKQKKNTQ